MIFQPHLPKTKKVLFTIPIFMVLALISFLFYQFQFWFLLSLYNRGTHNGLVFISFIIFNTAFLLLMASYAKIIITDPGKVTINQFDVQQMAAAMGEGQTSSCIDFSSVLGGYSSMSREHHNNQNTYAEQFLESSKKKRQQHNDSKLNNFQDSKSLNNTNNMYDKVNEEDIEINLSSDEDESKSDGSEYTTCRSVSSSIITTDTSQVSQKLNRKQNKMVKRNSKSKGNSNNRGNQIDQNSKQRNALSQGYKSEQQRAVQFKFCYRCNKVKPPRAHHCSLCERCVLRMDHHCPWVGNCVGFRNHKFFILFTFWASFTCAFEGIILLLAFFGEILKESKMSLPPTLFGAMILAFGVSFSVGGLCIFHVCLIAKNSSTIQMGRRSNPFDTNSLSTNFKQVFGSRKLTWFLPVDPSQMTCDGINYPNIFTRNLKKQVSVGQIQSEHIVDMSHLKI